MYVKDDIHEKDTNGTDSIRMSAMDGTVASVRPDLSTGRADTFFVDVVKSPHARLDLLACQAYLLQNLPCIRATGIHTAWN